MATFTSPSTVRIQSAAARIDPTSRGFVRVTAAVGILSFAAAFAVSGSSLYWAGGQIHLPLPIVVPLAMDAPMVAFALAALSKRARGQSTRSSIAWIGVFSAISVSINAWHSLSIGALGLDLIGALFLAVATPIAILATSEQILGVLVAPPAHNDNDRLQREARAADRLATTPAGPQPRARRGSDERADQVADVRDRLAVPGGVSVKELREAGFAGSVISEAKAGFQL